MKERKDRVRKIGDFFYKMGGRVTRVEGGIGTPAYAHHEFRLHVNRKSTESPIASVSYRGENWNDESLLPDVTTYFVVFFFSLNHRPSQLCTRTSCVLNTKEIKYLRAIK